MEKKTTFYVASYGGCGSKMLCTYLRKQGKTTLHIHSRNTSPLLRKNGIIKEIEWLTGEVLSKSEAEKCIVIYIYRCPIKAILSRHRDKTRHIIRRSLRNIQCEEEICKMSYDDFLKSDKDLFGLEEFYDNYVNCKINKNYDIYCIKYEDFFQNIEKFNETFGLKNTNYPICIENPKSMSKYEEKQLEKIYYNLKQKMSKMPFIYKNKSIM
jgi:hypothetical protein